MKKSVFTFLIVFSLIVLFVQATMKDSRKEISRRIVIDLTGKNFNDVRNTFSDSLKQKISVLALEEGWSPLLLQLGEFVEITSLTETKIQTKYQVTVDCKFTNDLATVKIVFNDDDKVIDLVINP
ncbi:MAG: hypothetical protein C0490_13585 [Marivirga sp.]|nr:hypothetical protein [Marivirga sp.]